MALEYKSHTKFEALAPILEEYATWFGEIAYQVAYLSDLGNEITELSLSDSFKNWVEAPETKEGLGEQLLEDIVKAHDDMVAAGGQILNSLKEKQKPTKNNFEELKNLYNAFLVKVRRVEKDSAYKGSGVDPDTGLRATAALEEDLKEEMERLSRQGNPFSIVISRIDFFAAQQDQKKAIEVVVRSIKKCMRSFDDAYYFGQGEFILSLKHADKIGAKAAIGRLQSFVSSDDENAGGMTMSYSYTEPSVGDEMPELLKNMRQDLIDHMNESNVVLELMEMSALERYAAKL